MVGLVNSSTNFMPLPSPIGHQKDVLHLPAEGHHAVLGTAGSGKTTLAILRAAYLADPETDHGGKTLLVTFNRTLVAYLRHLADRRLRNVIVENFHLFARGYLNSRGKIGRDQICTPEQRLVYIEKAMRQVARSDARGIVQQVPQETFDQEIQWIAQLGITTRESYGRQGISTDTSPNRPAKLDVVWAVRTAYESIRAEAGKLYDWDDLASAVYAELGRDTSKRLYRHIVIDEGQDFSPIMLRALTLAVPDDGSVTFFGDVAQQIYGRRFSWRDAGLEIAKEWKFEQNYRNSKQIAELALAITQMPGYRGIADIVSPIKPVADGPLPALVKFGNQAKEVTQILKRAKASSEVGSVAILTRGWQDKALFTQKLTEAEYIHLDRDLAVWTVRPNLYVGTYHSAKGLEFDTVYLPFLTGTRMPDPGVVENLGHAQALANEAGLIYVGVTRARTTLVLSYTGELTEILPRTDSLYQQTALD